MEASPHFRPTDEELAARTAAGDRAAFEELYRRYAGALASYARRIVRDRGEAEDVAQTAMLNAYRAIADGRAPRHVKPWLYKIAFHAALAARRKRIDVPEELVEPAGAEEGDSRAARESLLQGLAALPERQRRVYLLRELRGLTVSEIGAELSLRNEQVEQALFAAKNRLAEWISFGAPLTCGLVRTSRSLELSGGERRAVKAHLRSCEGCRGQFGASGIARSLGSYLSGFLGRMVGMLPAAGAPMAAKVGALATTAVIGAALGDPRLVRHFLPIASRASAAAVAPRHAVVAATPVALRLSPTDVVPAFVRDSAPGGGDRTRPVVGDAFLAAAAAGARGPGTGGTSVPPITTTTAATTTDGSSATGSTDATTTDQGPVDPNAGDGSDTSDSADTASADSGDGSDPAADPAATDSSTDPTATDPTATDPTATDTTVTDTTVTDTTVTDTTVTDTTAIDTTAIDTTVTDTTATDTTSAASGP